MIECSGLWGDIDPPDSQWLKLSVTDKNTGETTPKGEICYSIQIWPKDKALVMPVGAARSEPNTNPYLPPPVGRLKWSWNPFVLGGHYTIHLYTNTYIYIYIQIRVYIHTYIHMYIYIYRMT